MLEVTITNEQKVLITASPQTAAGNPAPIDGVLNVTVISGDSLAVPNDALSFYLVSSDTPGDTTFLVEADADLGEGAVLIQDTITLHVNGALAASFGLSAAAPEAK